MASLTREDSRIPAGKKAQRLLWTVKKSKAGLGASGQYHPRSQGGIRRGRAGEECECKDLTERRDMIKTHL